MSSEDFENLVCLVLTAVNKKNTNFRDSISVTECLALTLRILGTGELYDSKKYLFKVSKQSISLIIPQVCEAQINADSGLQFVKQQTRQKPFDLYRLATRLGRVAENTDICQGRTEKKSKNVL